jgi:hypothetical protein
VPSEIEIASMVHRSSFSCLTSAVTGLSVATFTPRRYALVRPPAPRQRARHR